MHLSISSIRRPFRFRGWAVAAAVACLGLSGCSGIGSRTDSFSAYETTNWNQEIKLPDAQGDFFGLSNRAQQIEHNLDR